MKKTALILALTLAMAPLAHAQQTTQQTAPPATGASNEVPTDSFVGGGKGVGVITTEMALVGVAIVAIAAFAIAGGDDDDGGVTTTTTTTTSN